MLRMHSKTLATVPPQRRESKSSGDPRAQPGAPTTAAAISCFLLTVAFKAELLKMVKVIE